MVTLLVLGQPSCYNPEVEAALWPGSAPPVHSGCCVGFYGEKTGRAAGRRVLGKQNTAGVWAGLASHFHFLAGKVKVVASRAAVMARSSSGTQCTHGLSSTPWPPLPPWPWGEG